MVVKNGSDKLVTLRYNTLFNTPQMGFLQRPWGGGGLTSDSKSGEGLKTPFYPIIILIDIYIKLQMLIMSAVTYKRTSPSRFFVCPLVLFCREDMQNLTGPTTQG